MYKLDNADALAGVRRLATMLQTFDAGESARLERTAERAERLVQWRIQQEGRNTAGDEMVSKSRNRIGAYSQMAGLDRQSRGLQTDYIDLTVTGALFAAWATSPDGTGGYGTGFTTDDAEYKASEIELLFGDVFGLMDEETDEVMAYHNELVTEDLRA